MREASEGVRRFFAVSDLLEPLSDGTADKVSPPATRSLLLLLGDYQLSNSCPPRRRHHLTEVIDIASK